MTEDGTDFSGTPDSSRRDGVEGGVNQNRSKRVVFDFYDFLERSRTRVSRPKNSGPSGFCVSLYVGTLSTVCFFTLWMDPFLTPNGFDLVEVAYLGLG